jgi:hypothetical protein
MKPLLLTLIEGRQKAVAAGIGSVIVLGLGLIGISGEMTVKEASIIIGGGIVNAYTVWKIRNR